MPKVFWIAVECKHIRRISLRKKRLTKTGTHPDKHKSFMYRFLGMDPKEIEISRGKTEKPTGFRRSIMGVINLCGTG